MPLILLSIIILWSITVDRNVVHARTDYVDPRSNFAHAHRLHLPNMSFISKFQSRGYLHYLVSVLGDLLTKLRETFFHELIIDQANLSSHFVEIANLLSSIKLHPNSGLQSPLVMGQNFCNLYNNNCFHGYDPGNKPLITNFACKPFNHCNGSTIPNPP